MLIRIQPDGAMTYVEALNARAKTRMHLRRFPFDSQSFEAIFGVLGFDKNTVVLELDPMSGSDHAVRRATISQWKTPQVRSSIREFDFNMQGRGIPVITFIVSLNMDRRAGFMLRLAVFPIIMLVMLSWSVFWMERSSLGDRIDRRCRVWFPITFFGINALTGCYFYIV